MKARSRRAADILTSEPRERLVEALLENVSRAYATREVETPPVWLAKRFDDGYEQQIATWPRTRRPISETEEQTFLEVPGFGILRVFAAPQESVRQKRIVEESVVWLASIMHAVPARRRLEKARHDAERANASVAHYEGRIAKARESERIRLVETLTTGTVRDLETVRAMLDKPAADVSWPSVSAAMISLIDNFRLTVRGVFPAMLPERGAVETLIEIAAYLPVAVTFRGDLGRRPPWEIESSFTQAVSAVLAAIAATNHPIEVIFERDGALRARIIATSGGVNELALALVADRERLESLGGALTISDLGIAGREVTVAVPDRSEVSWLPLTRRQLSSRPVHSRVAALLESVRLPEEEVAPLRAELFAPVRLLVLRQPLPASLPGVQSIACEEEPDRALAAQLRNPHGPWGRIDAVVCAGIHSDEFVQDLHDGPLLFAAGTDAADAVAMLAARAPVFAARRALAGVADYARRQSQTEWLRWRIEHLVAGSHELVEDALLDDLARGIAPSVLDDEGARLIGMHGGDKHRRLGLPVDASRETMNRAIDALLDRWRSIISRPELDDANRRAAEVVLGSTTRLLMILGVSGQ